MVLLPNLVAGDWRHPTGTGTPIRDATTGAEIARACSDGVDLAAALDHGRATGQHLRARTFHERARHLKTLAAHLREHRHELHELSATTGATRHDATVDVDGGIGVLFSYASKGRRELPDDTLHIDGPPERLGRDGTFLGQHVCTPLRGVAVQINAFNFPVWGPLEKLAPAYLAGMPALIKPATPTAHLTHRLVELIAESGALLDGAVQLVCGDPRDLLDHLTGQDVLAFTGSADTAQRLRAHPSITGRAVRFTAEADSLNCSVLGPDAEPHTPEFRQFVQQLVTEMTVKAGQKCTAIRRALVPADRIDAVAEAAAEHLSRTTIGDPRRSDVDMGALASVEQREEVRRSLKALQEAGRLVHGDHDHTEVLGADPQRGAFLTPALLRCDDPDRPEPHDVEAFGPVSTLMPYDTPQRAAELVRRGRGSLVGSLVTADPAFARALLRETASDHGRMLVLNRHNADESTGHGSPLPQLVHGGPGRAGGGEELGGLRAVLHHMQRTAVQADPDTLTALTHQWTPGSGRTETSQHPFRKHLDELRVGDTVVAGPRTITQQDIDHFAEFTGDTFYAHTDEQAARDNPFFGGRVAHGYLVLSFAAGLFVAPEPGPVLANYGLENLRFRAPTYPGDSITVTLTAQRITPRPDGDHGEVRWNAEVTNQDGAPVATYEVLTLVARGGRA